MNDALALSKATVGIAMGAGGSEVAIEASDVALVKSDLQGLVFLRRPAAGLNTEYIDPQITQISADYVACGPPMADRFSACLQYLCGPCELCVR